MSSDSFICKNMRVCFFISVFSCSSIASMCASSIAFPINTYKMGSASSSKSKRSSSLSLTWITLTYPSGFGTKIGEGYFNRYKTNILQVYLCNNQARATLPPPCCHSHSIHLIKNVFKTLTPNILVLIVHTMLSLLVFIHLHLVHPMIIFSSFLNNYL